MAVKPSHMTEQFLWSYVIVVGKNRASKSYLWMVSVGVGAAGEEPVKASRPIVDFRVLIDNTIKRLTYLYEIMSMNLIEKFV